MSYRVNISVKAEVAEKLAKLAKESGRSSFALASEILDKSLKILDEGGDMNQAIEAWEFRRLALDVELIPIVSKLVEDMVQRLFEVGKDNLLKSWIEVGGELANYLKMNSSSLKDAVNVLRLMFFQYTRG